MLFLLFSLLSANPDVNPAYFAGQVLDASNVAHRMIAAAADPIVPPPATSTVPVIDCGSCGIDLNCLTACSDYIVRGQVVFLNPPLNGATHVLIEVGCNYKGSPSLAFNASDSNISSDSIISASTSIEPTSTDDASPTGSSLVPDGSIFPGNGGSNPLPTNSPSGNDQGSNVGSSTNQGGVAIQNLQSEFDDFIASHRFAKRQINLPPLASIPPLFGGPSSTSDSTIPSPTNPPSTQGQPIQPSLATGTTLVFIEISANVNCTMPTPGSFYTVFMTGSGPVLFNGRDACSTFMKDDGLTVNSVLSVPNTSVNGPLCNSVFGVKLGQLSSSSLSIHEQIWIPTALSVLFTLFSIL